MARYNQSGAAWGYDETYGNMGPTAEKADALVEKGYLSGRELWEWPRPYEAIIEDGVYEKHPKLKISDHSQFHLDGRIKYHRRWVGRWWVGVDPRNSFAGSRYGPEGFWRVSPAKVHDPVYLARLLTTMATYIETVQGTRYNAVRDAIYEALPEGGEIYCDPRDTEGQTYWATVRVPSKEQREGGDRGLSFGSGQLEEPDTTGDPLIVLSRQEGYMRKLEIQDVVGHLGNAVNHYFRQRSNWWQRHAVIKEMLYRALLRHLPDPYQLERHGNASVRVEMRVEKTRYFFRLNREGRDGTGWSNVLTLHDDDASIIKFNFQPKDRA